MPIYLPTPMDKVVVHYVIMFSILFFYILGGEILEVKDIKELILTINNTDIETVEIHKGDFKIFISKGIISWRKTNPK